jgi:cytochrome P450
MASSVRVRRGLPLLGVLPQFIREAPEFLYRTAREHGDIVHLRVGRQDVFAISHPDWIQDILVTHQSQFKKSRALERARVLLGDGLLTNEGEAHKRQRRLVQPAFHRERLIGYASAMVACAAAASGQWRAGVPFDIAHEMMRLTMGIVAKTLFSSDVAGEADEIGNALTQVFEMFRNLLLPFSQYLDKIPVLPSVRKFHRARKRLDETIYRLIAERRASGEDKGDLLSMLLAAQEDGSGMSDKQVRDESLTLFVAGHETTATALTWSWYLLSQNPDVETKFHEELSSVLGGRLPTFNDLENLKYTEGVFRETLRLYPPAWAIGRRALKDYEVAGVHIRKGQILLMSPYVVQRDPRWFRDPLKFSPDRWMEGDEDRPKFSYFPFGGGARVCIGERFAWAEGVLLLATIGQKWKLRLAPGHKVATHATITLRSKYGMKMIAARRT